MLNVIPNARPLLSGTTLPASCGMAPIITDGSPGVAIPRIFGSTTRRKMASELKLIAVSWNKATAASGASVATSSNETWRSFERASTEILEPSDSSETVPTSKVVSLDIAGPLFTANSKNIDGVFR
jgi:hypothetical protein